MGGFYTVVPMDRLIPRVTQSLGTDVSDTRQSAGLGRFANPTPVGSPLDA